MHVKDVYTELLTVNSIVRWGLLAAPTRHERKNMRVRAIAYKQDMRPYGQPAENFRDATPRPQAVGSNRNVHRVADTSVQGPTYNSNICSSVKKNGEPCKGHKVGDSEFCSFHRG